MHPHRIASSLLLLSAGWRALSLPVEPRDGPLSPYSSLPRKPEGELGGSGLPEVHRRSNTLMIARRAVHPSPGKALARLVIPKSGNRVRKPSGAVRPVKVTPKPPRKAVRKPNKQDRKRAPSTGKTPKAFKAPHKPNPIKMNSPQRQRLRSTLRGSSSPTGNKQPPQRPAPAPLVIPASSTNNGPSSTTVEVGSPPQILTSPNSSVPPTKFISPATPDSPGPRPLPPGPPPSPVGGVSGDTLSQGAFGSSMSTVNQQMNWGRPGHPGSTNKR